MLSRYAATGEAYEILQIQSRAVVVVGDVVFNKIAEWFSPCDNTRVEDSSEITDHNHKISFDVHGRGTDEKVMMESNETESNGFLNMEVTKTSLPVRRTKRNTTQVKAPLLFMHWRKIVIQVILLFVTCSDQENLLDPFGSQM